MKRPLLYDIAPLHDVAQKGHLQDRHPILLRKNPDDKAGVIEASLRKRVGSRRKISTEQLSAPLNWKPKR